MLISEKEQLNYCDRLFWALKPFENSATISRPATRVDLLTCMAATTIKKIGHLLLVSLSFLRKLAVIPNHLKWPVCIIKTIHE